MSATRTQIYLTDEQRARIDVITERDGVPMAVVIRRAVDAYLRSVAPDPAEALRATFGVVPDIEEPDRDEWDRG